MTPVLAIGIDPTHSSVALVRLDTMTGEAELVGAWPGCGGSWPAWRVQAMDVARAVAQLAAGQPVVGWYRATTPYERASPARAGEAWNPCPMSRRAGVILAMLQAAGVEAAISPITAGRWTAEVRVPCNRQGDGAHRVEEAAARIGSAGLEIPDRCRIDCAGAMLIALACARAEAERRSGGQRLPLAAASNSASTMRPLTRRRASPAAARSGAALFSGENNMQIGKEGAPWGDPRWYAAGWMERGCRLIVVVYRGVEVIRRAHTGGTSCALAVQIAAAKLAAREAGTGAEVCLHDSVAWKMLLGEGHPQNPAVVGALQVPVPAVKYSLIPAASNPARALAFSAGAALLRSGR